MLPHFVLQTTISIFEKQYLISTFCTVNYHFHLGFTTSLFFAKKGGSQVHTSTLCETNDQLNLALAPSYMVALLTKQTTISHFLQNKSIPTYWLILATQYLTSTFCKTTYRLHLSNSHLHTTTFCTTNYHLHLGFRTTGEATISDHLNSKHQNFGPIFGPKFWVQNQSPSAYIIGGQNKKDVKISTEIDVR